MKESDLTIDQKDRVKRSMEELVRNIPAHVWSTNKTAPKRGSAFFRRRPSRRFHHLSCPLLTPPPAPPLHAAAFILSPPRRVFVLPGSCMRWCDALVAGLFTFFTGFYFV